LFLLSKLLGFRLEAREGRRYDSFMEIWAALLGAMVGGILTGLASWLTIRWQLTVESESREKQKKESINALLCALYHELDSVWAIYMQSIGQEIEKSPPAVQIPPKGFLMIFPITGDYFPVYEGNAASIGLIPDSLLRNKIITGYTLAKSLIDSYKMNNQFIWERRASLIEYHKAPANNPELRDATEKLLNMANWPLDDYGPKLRALHLQCKQSAGELLKQLEPFGKL
jgi:hypothetical protein